MRVGSTPLLSDITNTLTTVKDTPVPFNRLSTGSVLSDPRGRRTRYMKITMNNQYFWAASIPTIKGTYTDKEMRERVSDDGCDALLNLGHLHQHPVSLYTSSVGREKRLKRVTSCLEN